MKRFLSLLLTLCMAVSVMSGVLPAYAADTTDYVWSIVNDDDSRITYTGAGWGRNDSDVTPRGAGIALSGAVGDSVEFTFYGVGIRYHAMTHLESICNDNIEVWLDGVKVQNISLVGSGFNRILAFEKTGLENKSHTIKLVNGTPVAVSAAYPAITLDYFEVANDDVYTRVDDRAVTYAAAPASGWITPLDSYDGAYGRTLKGIGFGGYDTESDFFSYKFTGTGIRLGFQTYNEACWIKVSIDGGAGTWVNLYDRSVTAGAPVFCAAGLPMGEHTVTVSAKAVLASGDNSGQNQGGRAIGWFDYADILGVSDTVSFTGLEVEDAANWKFKLTFSEPVNINNTGLIYLCDKPDPNPGVDGSWQVGCTGIEYVAPTNSGGKDYSDTVILTFAKNSFIVPDAGGVRICEYGAGSAGDGVLPVVTTASGKQLHSNVSLTGSWDCAWHTYDDSSFTDLREGPSYTGLEVVNADAWQVRMTFSEPVNIENYNYIYMCDVANPNPGAGSSWQTYCTGMSYENPETVGGKQYASSVLLTFKAGYQYSPQTLPSIGGVRVCEYGVGTAYDGYLPYITDTDGNALLASMSLDGGWDCAWQTYEYEDPADPSAYVWTRYSDDDSRISYQGGGWNFFNADLTPQGAGVMVTTSVGAAAEFTFTGTGIRYYAMTHVDTISGNNVKVYLDGVLQDTVSLTDSGFARKLAFEKTRLSDTKHTIRIVNGDSTVAGQQMTIDYFEVATAGEYTRVDDSAMTFTTTPASASIVPLTGYAAATYGSSLTGIAFSAYDTESDFFTYKFTGTGIRLGFQAYNEACWIKVSIDGNEGVWINLFDRATVAGLNAYCVTGLPNVEHTLSVTAKAMLSPDTVTDGGGRAIAWLDYADVFTSDETVVSLTGAQAVDRGAWSVRLTFNAPVHIENPGFIYLCNQINPNDNGGKWDTGDWQSAANRIAYESPSIIDGKQYSASVVVTFDAPTMASAPSILGGEGSCVRICEYGIGTVGDYFIPVSVLHGAADAPLYANRAVGGSDVAFAEISYAGFNTSLISVSSADSATQGDDSWHRLLADPNVGTFSFPEGTNGRNTAGSYPQPSLGWGQSAVTTFTGTAFKLYALRHASICCSADIYVDNELKGTATSNTVTSVDGIDFEAEVFSLDGLDYGTHTLKIVSKQCDSLPNNLFLPEYVEYFNGTDPGEWRTFYCDPDAGSFTFPNGNAGRNTAGSNAQPILNVGQSAEIVFSGTALELYGVRHATLCCDADIYIDGVKVGTADGTAVASTDGIDFGAKMFSISGLTKGSHTLKIESVKHGSLSNAMFLPEYIKTYYEKAPTATNNIYFDPAAGSFTFSTAPSTNGAGSYIQPVLAFGNAAETTFFGTGVTLYGVTHATICCDADVYIDGVLRGTADGTVVTGTTGMDTEAEMLSITGLSNAEHTFRLVSKQHGSLSNSIFLPEYITVTAETQTVRATFDNAVKIKDLSAVTLELDGKVYRCAAVSYVGSTDASDIVDFSFAGSGKIDNATLVIADAVGSDGLLEKTVAEDVNGGRLIATRTEPTDAIAKSLNAITDPTVATGEDLATEIVSGEVYSLMNCDTGRYLGGEAGYYTFTNAGGVNRYFITDESGKYLGADGSFSDAPYAFLIVKGTNGRFKVKTADGASTVRDTDEGTSNAASLGWGLADNLIENLWYLTGDGEAEPLRVMPLGDSITYGIDQDELLIEQWGCKPELSAMLKGGLDNNRIILVGSVKAQKGLESDTVLYRGEGHPGWLAHNEYQYVINNGEAGLDEYIDAWQTKYAPDVICMMIGTNDCGYLTSDFSEKKSFDETFDGWENLTAKILDNLGEDGLLVAATLTPHGSSTTLDNLYKRWSDCVEDAVAELQAAGEDRIALADNYGYILSNESRVNATCSDNLHLSRRGYTLMAESYYKAVKLALDGVNLYEEKTGITAIKAEMVGTNQILVTFSDDLELTGEPFTAMRLVNADGSLVWDGAPNSSTPMQWYGSWKYYTDTAKDQILWTMAANNGNTYGINNLVDLLNYKGIESMKAEGRKIVFCIEETTTGGATAFPNDEVICNFSSLGNDGYLTYLSANTYNYDSLDRVYLVPENTTQPTIPEVTEATAINDSQIVVRFNKPVSISEDCFVAIRMTDAAGNLVWDGEVEESTPMQWYGSWKYYDDAHTAIIFTMAGDNTYGANNIFDLIHYKGDLSKFNYGYRISIEENPGEGMVMCDGFVNGVTDADGLVDARATYSQENFLDAIQYSFDWEFDSSSYLTLTGARAVNASQILVSFSSPVEMAAAPFIAVRLVDGNCELGWTGEPDESTPLQWDCKWEYASADKKSLLLTLSTVNLGCGNLTEIFNYEGQLGAYKNKGFTPMLCFEEMPVEGKVEIVMANGLLENVSSVGGTRHLKATKVAGWDKLYADITLDYDPNTVTLVSAKAVSASEIDLTFSEAVKIDGKPYFAVRMVDENGDLVWDGKPGESTPMQWAGDVSFGNAAHTVVRFTMTGGNTYGINNLTELLSYSGKLDSFRKYGFLFCIEESGDVIPGSGLVDNIKNARGNMLKASRVKTDNLDGVYTELSVNYVMAQSKLVSAEAVAQNKIVLTFSEPVELRNEPFVALRYLDGNNDLLWAGARDSSTPLQFYGTWDYFDEAHTQIIWSMNGGNTLGANTITDVFNYAGELKAYEGSRIRVCIEELGEGVLLGNGIVENVVSSTGKYLTGNKWVGGGTDRVYSEVKISYDTEKTVTFEGATAVSERDVILRFSEPVNVKTDGYGAFFAIRYLDADGNLVWDGEADASTPMQFTGTWTYNNDDHTEIKWTMDETNTYGAKNITEVLHFGYNLKPFAGSTIAFCIEEIPDEGANEGMNLLICNITEANGPIQLTATKQAGRDGAYAEIKVEYDDTFVEAEDTSGELGSNGKPYNYLWLYLTCGGILVAGAGAGTWIILAGKKRKNEE